MNFKYLLYACILILAACTAGTEESYWTRFRGADGCGIDNSGNVPSIWESSDFKWKIQLPGTGNSSPLTWNNTVFITSADEEQETGFLTAVDGSGGDVLWQKEFPLGELAMHVDNKLATQTPAVDKSRVYVIWYGKEKTSLLALSHKGKILWESDFEGIVSRHGGGSSLSLTDDLVVFTREQEDFSTLKSSWVAVNKNDGEIVWEVQRESPENNSFACPLWIKGDQSSLLVFCSQSHGISGVDPETGEIIWELKDLLPSRVVGSPFYIDGKIILNRNGEALVLDYDPVSKQVSDSARYKLPRNLSPYVPTPIAVGELLFTFRDNGTVSCMELATGKLLWKEKPAGPIYGSPVCLNGKLYCATKDGQVIVLKADSSYQLLGVNELGEGSFSTPAMCSSGMVFRTFKHLMMLENS